jgi:hypothetical protein
VSRARPPRPPGLTWSSGTAGTGGPASGCPFLYVLPPAGAIIGLAAGAATAPAAVTAGAGLAGWALMSLTYLPMLRLYRLSPLRAPGLPLIAMLYAAMTVDSAWRHYAGGGAEWKGRTDRARLRLPLADKHGTDRLWADKPGNGWRRYLIADVFTATPLEGN